MAYYKDIREYIKALEEKGKLVRVTRPINKDTELHPLVRLQFRGLPEEERKVWLFENVYDAKGKKYDIPVIIGALGASPQVYAIGMMCQVEEIGKKWAYAQSHPLKPVMVKKAPVQEVVLTGNSLLQRGGLGEFPIPVSTPGWDIAPYVTSPYWVTKDPENGIRNVGTYRAQIKSPTRTGAYGGFPGRGIVIHWNKAKKLGKPLEAALIVGAAPHIGYVSVSRLPVDVDEFTVAGGIAGEPVELVKCKTVDLEVPATAEIVIEGEISTKEIEPEAPFGEAHGQMGQQELAFFFDVKCITHRKNPIWQAFLSQMPPSESSVIRGIGAANVIPNRLKNDLKMPHVLDVVVHFSSGNDRFSVIRMAKTTPAEVWRALEAMPQNFPDFSKVVIAVDEDINPWDVGLVTWALTYRAQPHRDYRIIKTHNPNTWGDYSVEPPPESGLQRSAWMDPVQESLPESSSVLIDATIKWPFPPISLPKKEYMDHALKLWKEMGMPELNKLREPWYGYSLGYWTKENEEQADLALRGEHYKTGEEQARRRQKAE